MKKIRLMMVMAFLVASSCLAGCEYYYIGDYPELYTVALSSLFDVLGYYDEGGEPGRQSPDVEVLERDDHGRVLFCYREYASVTLLICQYSDDEYAYFYRYYNFMPQKFNWEYRDRPYSKENFPPEQLSGIYVLPSNSPKHNWMAMRSEKGGLYTVAEVDEFKRLNDWNEPLVLHKAAKAKITNKMGRGPIGDGSLRNVINLAFGDRLRIKRIPDISRFVTTDDFGRSAYHIWTRDGRNFVLLFQADGSFDPERGFMWIFSERRYQDDLKQFMERNGWDEPLDFVPSWPGWPPGVIWTSRESVYENPEDGDDFHIRMYDARGNLLMLVRCDSQYNVGNVEKYYIPGYRSDIIYHTTDGDKKIAYIEEYNASEIMVKLISYNWSGNQLSDTEEYNDLGILVKKTYYHPNGNISQISEYNDVGMVVSSTYSVKNNGSKYLYTGKLALSTYYAEDGSIKYSYIYEYDADGNMISRVYRQ